MKQIFVIAILIFSYHKIAAQDLKNEIQSLSDPVTDRSRPYSFHVFTGYGSGSVFQKSDDDSPPLYAFRSPEDGLGTLQGTVLGLNLTYRKCRFIISSLLQYQYLRQNKKGYDINVHNRFSAINASMALGFVIINKADRFCLSINYLFTHNYFLPGKLKLKNYHGDFTYRVSSQSSFFEMAMNFKADIKLWKKFYISPYWTVTINPMTRISFTNKQEHETNRLGYNNSPFGLNLSYKIF